MTFGLFDDGVSIDTKRQIVAALDKTGIEHPLKRITLKHALISSKQLEDFVTENTRRFFSMASIPARFLQQDVDTWPKDENYKLVKDHCQLN